MRIAFTVGPYSAKHYSKPWISKVTKWKPGRPPALKFGKVLDNNRAEIEANPGDVLRYGQKNYRGGESLKNFAIVNDDGSVRIVPLEEAAEAFRNRANESGAEELSTSQHVTSAGSARQQTAEPTAMNSMFS